MKQENLVSGQTIDEIWQQVGLQLNDTSEILDYNTVIVHAGRKTILSIDIDLGGGFESGFETTTFTAELEKQPTFKFAIHQEHFTDEIGKFFGMQDVVIGYKDFDEKLIIKTDDKAKVRRIFSDMAVRETILSLSDFSFGITQHHKEDHKKAWYLELNIEQGITNVEELREIYKAFLSVLQSLESTFENSTVS